MDSYQSLSARVYDFDKPVGTSFGDLEFYRDCLEKLPIKGAILEPAVGTGRLMIPLLKQGFDLYGFDLSPQMLNICKENLVKHEENPERVYQASFTDFHYDQQFAAIVIPSGTFLLMIDNSDIQIALKNFHAHLMPEGQLIFDIFLQPDFQVGRTQIREFPISDHEKITLTMTETEINHLTQVTTTYHRYEVWKKHQLIETELEVFRLKWLGLQEIELLLTNAGFQNIQLIANYQHLEMPKNATDTITVIATK
ncbi:MAG TPA: class I SAM-dependent methyltransferase [Candidatus Ignatzschineria merdigallinarum]|uniref:Class I SAM-dependent methyltransferase n=1 Tax=Candidatus Ignatzschineria merdigallinarum TaxID=2838621 RepID=A0A9D1Q4N9_9GAMM|nr:class I SAM-dependent methyltransferase [Candidatus Ignatzschineria merdigallinarum]